MFISKGGGDPHEIAAAYAYHIAESQAYLDGNKRTGAQAAFVFLEGCGIDTSRLPEQQTYEAMIKIATYEMGRSIWLSTFDPCFAGNVPCTLERETGSGCNSYPG